jgi:hypothetical protein
MSTPTTDSNAELVSELRTTLATLNTTVTALTATVADIEKRLRFVWAAALMVVGAVGGPSAVAAIAGH